MALEINLPADLIGIAEEAKFLFIGDDTTIRFQIGNDDATLATIAAGTATMVDVDGWALSFIVRKADTTTGTPLLTKTTSSGITITGTFDALASNNTQRVVVAIDDTDTAAADGSSVVLKPNTYRYSLKRTDDGSEKILAFGDFVLTEATNR